MMRLTHPKLVAWASMTLSIPICTFHTEEARQHCVLMVCFHLTNQETEHNKFFFFPSLSTFISGSEGTRAGLLDWQIKCC